MHKHLLPSIEKFAAFLDGNLSQSEMQQFTQLAEHNEAMHQLLDACLQVDETIASYTDEDIQLPPEIISPLFEIPDVSADGIVHHVPLTSESEDDELLPIAACADEYLTQIATDITEENTEIPDILENPIQATPETGVFEDRNDLSNCSDLLDDI